MKERASSRRARIQVWDIPTRLFHWTLVVVLLVSWRTARMHAMEWHLLSGSGILALLVFRIFWGFFGSSTARFAQFVRSPRATFTYLRGSRGRDPAKLLGHNPLGAWSILAMLAILLAMVTTGLFSIDIDGLVSGPLADHVEFDTGREAADLHAQIFAVLQAIVAFHVVAIAIYLFRRHNLIAPMVTGSRPASGDDAGALVRAPLRNSLAGIALATLWAYAVAHDFWL